MRGLRMGFFKRLPNWVKALLLIGLCMGGAAGAYGLLWLYSEMQSSSNHFIREWLTKPDDRAELHTSRRPCGDAPFLLPSEGLVGLLWRDPAAPYNVLRRHSGIDIFGDGEDGTVPVFAVYDGLLTRLPDWLSSVIIQHQDPLNPGQYIWTYYTHMASRDGETSYISAEFPPGTAAKPVQQGTLLGYQGSYSGAGVAVAMHVHLSIVKSDENGSFLNEAVLENTLDPSPYFGLPLNIDSQPSFPIRCPEGLGQ